MPQYSSIAPFFTLDYFIRLFSLSLSLPLPLSLSFPYFNYYYEYEYTKYTISTNYLLRWRQLDDDSSSSSSNNIIIPGLSLTLRDIPRDVSATTSILVDILESRDTLFYIPC